MSQLCTNYEESKSESCMGNLKNEKNSTSQNSSSEKKATSWLYIDILKILSIFFIALLHSTAYGVCDIHGTHWHWMVLLNSTTRAAVPLFVICSGAMLLGKSEPIADFYKKRLYKIVVPFLAWAVIYELHLWRCGLPRDLFSIIKNIIFGNVMYHLWFVYMILALYFITPFLRYMEFSKRKALPLLAIWLGIALIDLIGNLTGTPFMLSKYFLSAYIFFFLFGSWLHERIEKISVRWRLALWAAVIFILCCIVPLGTFHVSKEGLNELFFGNGNFFVIVAALSIFTLFRTYEESFKKYLGRFTAQIRFLSSLTYGIYLVHILFLDYFYNLLAHGNYAASPIPRAMPIILAAVTFLVSALFIAILKKIPILKKIV